LDRLQIKRLRHIFAQLSHRQGLHRGNTEFSKLSGSLSNLLLLQLSSVKLSCICHNLYLLFVFGYFYLPITGGKIGTGVTQSSASSLALLAISSCCSFRPYLYLPSCNCHTLYLLYLCLIFGDVYLPITGGARGTGVTQSSAISLALLAISSCCSFRPYMTMRDRLFGQVTDQKVALTYLHNCHTGGKIGTGVTQSSASSLALLAISSCCSFRLHLTKRDSFFGEVTDQKVASHICTIITQAGVAQGLHRVQQALLLS